MSYFGSKQCPRFYIRDVNAKKGQNMVGMFLSIQSTPRFHPADGFHRAVFPKEQRALPPRIYSAGTEMAWEMNLKLI